VSDVVNSMVMLRDVAEHARKNGRWDDDAVRREVGQLAAELDALWLLIKRNVSEATHNGVPGAGASVFKLRYSELRLRLGDLAVQVLGRGRSR
jgi:alkylation response protein AidB-like acyl-CoA dehydrogenase